MFLIKEILRIGIIIVYYLPFINKNSKNRHGEMSMNVWVLALLVYVSLFIISLSIAFMIDTLRLLIRRVVAKR